MWTFVKEKCQEHDFTKKIFALIKCRSRVKAIGKAADVTMVHVFDVKDGKIKRFREFFDTAEVLKAFVAANAAGSKK